MSAQTATPTAPAGVPTDEDLYKLYLSAQQADANEQSQTAVGLYTRFVNSPSTSPDLSKLKEEAISRAGLLVKSDEERLAKLLRDLEPAWLLFPRAKTAKVVRSLLDLFPPSSTLLIDLLRELVEWCSRDRRFYLKQSLQVKLASVQFVNGKCVEALEILSGLSRELRRLDDKLSLVEVHLLESQILFTIKATAKSKAALTAARTNANAVYCPPLLLAELDLQSGLLHADDGDYNTASSYFVESLDGYTLAGEDGSGALKYLLLCKVILGQDLTTALEAKSAKPHAARATAWIEAFKSTAAAYQEKSLQLFDVALSQYNELICSDKTIQQHLHNLYDTLLEKNLLKLVAPFSHVPLAQLAEDLRLALPTIEQKLVQMILDEKLHAVIDQYSEGTYLVRVEPSEESPLYTAAITAIRNMDKVVEGLLHRARSIQ